MENIKFGRSRQTVRLIGINAPFEPSVQFGFVHAAELETRDSTNNQWQVSHIQGRSQTPAAIKQPLPVREQTIMLSQLPADVQREIISGFSTLPNQGRAAEFMHSSMHQVKVGAPIQNSTKRQVYAAAKQTHINEGLRTISASVHR
jgi:hypothetical protein